jgi:hypothetical protein
MPISAPFSMLPSTRWEAIIFSVTVFAVIVSFALISLLLNVPDHYGGPLAMVRIYPAVAILKTVHSYHKLMAKYMLDT